MTNNSCYYRPLQYLGAKTRVLSKILTECDKLYVPNSYVVDLFSGSSIVSQVMYKHGMNVISNDVLGFCCDIAASMLNYKKGQNSVIEILNFVNNLHEKLLENNNTICFNEYLKEEEYFLSQHNLVGLKELYAKLPQVKNTNKGNQGQIDYIYQHFGNLVNEKALLVSNYYAGTYFGIKQSLEIDLILNAIFEEKTLSSWAHCVLLTALYNTCSLVVNSAGKHFAQPMQIVDLNINKITNVRLFENRQLDVKCLFVECVNNILNKADQFEDEGSNVVLNEDMCTRSFQDEISKHNVSVIYADPPYTAQQYSRFYHIPEVLHNYRYPQLQIFRGNVTQGIYPDKKYKSPFCSKIQAKFAFSKIFELVRNCNASLVLSYSESKQKNTGNERMISIEDVMQISSEYLPGYQMRQIDFSFDYKQLNSKSKIVGNKEDKEILMIFAK